MTCRCVRIFLQAFTRRHVPRATCRRPTRDRHHCRSGVSARPSVPPRSRSDQPIGRYSRKCLDTHTHTHTHTQTDKHDPANFFSPTHRRKSSFIRTCYAKALAPSILYDFGLISRQRCLTNLHVRTCAMHHFVSFTIVLYTIKEIYRCSNSHVAGSKYL